MCVKEIESFLLLKDQTNNQTNTETLTTHQVLFPNRLNQAKLKMMNQLWMPLFDLLDLQHEQETTWID